VIHFDVLDLADNLVGGGVDQVHVVARAVGLDNADLSIGGRQRRCQYEDADRREVPQRSRDSHSVVSSSSS
jgi:hypothetical protein